MDLHTPLATIAPTLDAEALTALADAEMPLTVGQVVARVRRGSRPGIRTVLDRLSRDGLVTALPVGNAVVYSLNREHLLASVVLAAARARQTLVERIGAQVSLWEIPPAHAALLPDDAETGAAVLLAVRTPLDNTDRATWRAQLRDLADAVHRWTGNELALRELTVDQLERAEAGEVEEWQRGTRVGGVPLADLLAPAFVPLVWNVVT